MSRITDGTGTSTQAKVTTTNKLEVSARTNERVYYASRDYFKAFFVQFELTQASGDATEGIGYIQYTGDNRLNIKQVTFTSEDAGMAKFGVWKNPTVTDGVVATPINLNFASSITASVTCMEDADGSTVSITGGASIYTYRLHGVKSEAINFFDAVILSKNDIIGFKGSASTTGSKLRVNVLFHESIT